MLVGRMRGFSQQAFIQISQRALTKFFYLRQDLILCGKTNKNLQCQHMQTWAQIDVGPDMRIVRFLDKTSKNSELP